MSCQGDGTRGIGTLGGMAGSTVARLSDEQLRPAIEAAFAFAVAGRRQRPPIAPPEVLRPYLKFEKAPRKALSVVRRLIDDDADFRAAVAAATPPASIGEGLHGWLARPEGWEAPLLAAVVPAGDADEDAARDRRALKRRAAAEAAAARAAAELAELRGALGREQAARLGAEQTASDLRTQIDALRREIEGLQRRARRASEVAATRAGELTRAQETIEALEQRLVDTESIRDLALVERAELEDDAERAPAHAPAAASAKVESAVREAATSLRTAAAALESAASSIGVPARPATPPQATRHPRQPGVHRLRRRPLAMPGGVSASSVDGALHLLKSPELELVVDGYNVAMLAWPNLELAARRERCIDAVEDIIRRYGTRALVVFDGADVSVAVTARRLARVRFSPAGVIADDVIREVVASLPAEQPVAVASNDKEVVSSVRAMGANTITSETLLAAAGRALR